MDKSNTASWSAGNFDALRSAFIEALGRGDAEAAVQVYANDARMLLPATGPMDGRAAIQAFWRAGLESGMTGLTLEPTLLDGEMAFACEIGRYVLHAKPQHEAAVVEEGRYLIVHRQDATGAWRRALEIFEPMNGSAAR
jgi:uncharacterized protein (TIGR02246 family)